MSAVGGAQGPLRSRRLAGGAMQCKGCALGDEPTPRVHPLCSFGRVGSKHTLSHCSTPVGLPEASLTGGGCTATAVQATQSGVQGRLKRSDGGPQQAWVICRLRR